jgi:hypothetical protein
MILGIMQPYFLPYIGYFQLLAAVDHFILLDDVSFIKKGWIHRNRLLLQNQPHLFSIPVQHVSQNRKIIDTRIIDENTWKSKLEKTVALGYKRAPQFKVVFPLFQEIIHSPILDISEFVAHSIRQVAGFLGIATPISTASTCHPNMLDKKGEERILEICIRERADTYINPIGGIELYHEESFRGHGINLKFHRAIALEYPQFGGEFVPFLSILDHLMFCDKALISDHLQAYKIVLPAQFGNDS